MAAINPHRVYHPRARVRRALWIQRATIILHAVAVIWVAYGVYLRLGFHNGEECNMTYSMRVYVPIQAESQSPTTRSHYNLYKFVDARDPRHQKLLQAKEPVRTTEHCTKDPFIVLYVPGHWGSYSQCRSVGAHGTQLTRQSHDGAYVNNVRRALLEGSWNGEASEEENFVYDVYCIDFAEQGAALHGNFVQRQSKYVAEVVQQLTRQCSVTTITLVAHSIGGLVAKTVPVYFPAIGDKIRNIITLGTPHASLPYAFDVSLDTIYKDLDRLDKSILITSISGGLKDELIPPSLCKVPNGVSRVAGTRYGMDHKAIVWCHQVLEKVRKILFVLSQDESNDRRSLVEQVGIVNESYDQFVSEQKQRYIQENGYLKWIALESAMMYNAALLLSMFSLLCALNLILLRIEALYSVLVVAVASSVLSHHEISYASTAVLVLFVSSVFGVQQRVLKLIAGKRPPRNMVDWNPFETIFRMVTITFLFIVISAAIAQVVLGKMLRFHFLASLELSLALTVLITAVRFVALPDAGGLVFVSLILIAIPVLMFGKFVLFCWNIFDDYGGVDWMTLGVLLSILFRCGLLPRTCPTGKHRPVFVAAHVLNLLVFMPLAFRVGGAFHVGYYLACVSLIESARVLV